MSRGDEDREKSGTRVMEYGVKVPVAKLSSLTGGEQIAASDHLGPGSLIYQYEIIRELGRGGMGRVFVARDTRLGRRVAIKCLLRASPTVAQRFLVEARATAQCQHENIVIIHEVNELDGMPFMVLEYLEGQNLRDAMAQGAMPASRAIELMVPVAKALVRAHELGILHRDLKPENIFLSESGLVKVLDFGIAKALAGPDSSAAGQRKTVAHAVANADSLNLTVEGSLIGTLPYMSPEQCGMDEVDHRTDIWAVGIMLFELLTGRHPLEPLTPTNLIHAAAQLDTPLPSIRQATQVTEGLAFIVDGCLRKHKSQRIASASELVGLLEDQLPGRRGRRLAEGECPYPGLTAFQEADADRFFGRSRDIARMVARLREHPLTGVIGPSGVGKSSFVRAGVVPALKASGESWETLVVRPGRNPLAALASLLQPITTSSGTDVRVKMSEHEQLVARLRETPGYLGTLLRSWARQQSSHILLFVDQFEELYTLVPDPGERAAFVAALSGVADDAATPLRVVVSMRSDFLDRVSEDQTFLDELSRGMVFLTPPDRAGLREALVQPVEMVGFRYESSQLVEAMLNELDDTDGALPLLQFAAAKLWDGRDRERRVLTEANFHAIGGIVGALASHADEVLTGLSPTGQKLTRAIFTRMVTPERTRAIVDVAELTQLAQEPDEVRRVIDQLVHARLIVVQKRGDTGGASAEIVHESLIERWPTLRRWLDEGQEDAAFIAQLRTAAQQWDGRGRPNGLLWRGEAMEEARRWNKRRQAQLAQREEEYLAAVFAQAARSARLRRAALVVSVTVLGLVAAGAVIAMLLIQDAKNDAQKQAVVAKREMKKAREAEKQITRQLELVKRKEAERLAAENQRLAAEEQRLAAEEQRLAAEADKQRAESNEAEAKEDLAAKNRQLEKAVVDAERARKKAESAQQLAEEREKRAKELSAELDKRLKREQAERQRLEREMSKLSTKLK